jgi:hypothetical protein
MFERNEAHPASIPISSNVITTKWQILMFILFSSDPAMIDFRALFQSGNSLSSDVVTTPPIICKQSQLLRTLKLSSYSSIE